MKNYESFPLANMQGEEEVGIMGSPPCMGIPLSVVGIFHISSQVLIYQYNIFSIEGPMKGYYFSERGGCLITGSARTLPLGRLCPIRRYSLSNNPIVEPCRCSRQPAPSGAPLGDAYGCPGVVPWRRGRCIPPSGAFLWMQLSLVIFDGDMSSVTHRVLTLR